MSRPAHWRKRRIGARLGIFALSMNALLAFAQAAPAGTGDKDFPSLESLVTCTVYGPGGKPPADDGGDGSPARSNCPVCLTQSLCGGLLLPSSVAFALPAQAPPARYAIPALFLNDDFRHQRPYTRGPPFAA